MTDLTFEDCLSRLEQIVVQLESGQLTLEAALKAFEEGIGLARHCGRYLDNAERRIELLTKDDGGGLDTQPFTLPTEETR